jgi:hypothetical protein
MKLYVFLWESAAADRDDRGWSLLRRSSCLPRHGSPACDSCDVWIGCIGYEGREPLPQGRHFIAGRTAHRAVSHFVNTLGAEFQHEGEDVDSPPRCCYEPRTIC